MTKPLPETERRVLELHVMRARELAIRLFKASSAVYPKNWDRQVVEPAILDLFDFAFHARRIEELTGIKTKEKEEMGFPRFSIRDGGPTNVCKVYSIALDLIVHAKTLVVGTMTMEAKVFLNSANLNLGYATVETSDEKSGTIFIYGFVLTFLNHVIPELRNRYPQLSF